MRKLLIGLAVLLLLIAALPVALMATGTISSSSLRMVMNVMTGMTGPATSSDTVKQRFTLPDGFHLQLYADKLPRARFMLVTPAGDLLVSRPHSGDIMLLRRDINGDGRADATETLLQDLKRPLGMALKEGWLYIAESNRIGRIAFDSDRSATLGQYQPLIEGLTDNGNHWSKTIGFGPDGLLYLAQGSTCNVCEEQDTRRATMMRFQPNGSGGEIIATGLRNSVGFDWTPWDGALYATDNGRDMLGDDFPPCELNLIEQGKFYGWPYFNGDNLADPDMGADPLAAQRQPSAPVHGFRAHNAPLGIRFIEGSGMPQEYQQAALVALHGSWNRSTPDGYKVVSLHWQGDGVEERDFLTGFNSPDGDIIGRPVDIAQGPDGAIYVSDDYAGAIYKISYGAAGNNAARQLPLVDMPAGDTRRLDDTPPDWLSDADLPALAADGAALYRRYACAACHEQGDNPVDLENLNQRLGYAAVIEVLRAPQSPMPVFPLGEIERRQLAVYLLNEQAAGAQ